MFEYRLFLLNVINWPTLADLFFWSGVVPNTSLDWLILKPFALDPQHVTMEDSYLCGYLKIKGLTEVRRAFCGQCNRISTDILVTLWPAVCFLVAVDLITVYDGAWHTHQNTVVFVNGDFWSFCVVLLSVQNWIWTLIFTVLLSSH